ncbi:MAG: DUF2244 domain-containing protein [Pseudomonadota bacterium]
MPYQWTPARADTIDAPRDALHLWPHRSLTNRGFALFFGVSFVLICMPMVAVLGSPVLWALMPFMFGTLWLTWAMIRMNDRALAMTEELLIWDDRIALTRREGRGRERRWEANPHWVQVALHEESGPVPNYVTLRGGDREVEIGAFLSPEERAELYEDLSRRLGGGMPPAVPKP